MVRLKVKKFGIAKFLVVALLLGGGLAYGVKVVQQNQENRSNAAKQTIDVGSTEMETIIPSKISVNGVCGSSKNSCKIGSLKDINDFWFHYRWKCVGLNGGDTSTCYKRKW